MDMPKNLDIFCKKIEFYVTDIDIVAYFSDLLTRTCIRFDWDHLK